LKNFGCRPVKGEVPASGTRIAACLGGKTRQDFPFTESLQNEFCKSCHKNGNFCLFRPKCVGGQTTEARALKKVQPWLGAKATRDRVLKGRCDRTLKIE